MMDVRNRELGKTIRNSRNEWEPKVADKIQHLAPAETGYQKLINLKMNGRPQKTELYETILKVMLDKPILPKTKVLLEAEFEAQVPVQVRRAAGTIQKVSGSVWHNGIPNSRNMTMKAGIPHHISEGNFMEYGATIKSISPWIENISLAEPGIC